MIGMVLSTILATPAAQPADVPNFARDIRPIMRARCVSCHRPDGDGPFSLETYDEVRRRASTIASVTTSRYMPPWKPAPGHGEFQGTRRLTDNEIAVITRWAANGAPEGSGPPATGAPVREAPPDLEVRLPAFTLPADGPDSFRNFVVPVPSGARIVRGLQFRPGNRAVHHANIRVDTTGASRALDAADPSAGYEGIIARSADFPDGQFLGWTPGQLAPVLSDDTAWRLPAGADLVVQLHMRATGAVEQIAPTVALYFGERLPALRPVMIRLGKQNLDIPPGAAGLPITDSFVLPVSVTARAIQAHAHTRATSVEAYATRPDGVRVPLLRISEWDVNWQDRYVYHQPIGLPAGSRITSTYTFTNSTSTRASWGWRTDDEMADVWLQVGVASAADRAALEKAVTPKMLAEDAIGSEVLLAREPNHLHLHNDVAQIYLALGQPGRALTHFETVVRLDPDSATAVFNEGVALEALGRLGDAEAKYAAAIVLSPAYSPALNNAGALLLRSGRLAESRPMFLRAIEADPRNADAHANLGLAMIAAGESDEGLRRTMRAIEINQGLLRALTPHVVLLAANADATARRPRDAMALAERVLGSGADQAVALDALAMCHAAIGAFDQAVQTADAALTAAPAPSPALRSAIQQRIALYRRKQPFVLTP